MEPTLSCFNGYFYYIHEDIHLLHFPCIFIHIFVRICQFMCSSVPLCMCLSRCVSVSLYICLTHERWSSSAVPQRSHPWSTDRWTRFASISSVPSENKIHTVVTFYEKFHFLSFICCLWVREFQGDGWKRRGNKASHHKNIYIIKRIILVWLWLTVHQLMKSWVLHTINSRDQP